MGRAGLGGGVYVNSGAADLGGFVVRPSSLVLLKARNGGTVRVRGAGGVGGDSATAITLDTGGSFLARGTQTFGANNCSFSLGPERDAATLPPGTNILQAVALAKAEVSDRARHMLSVIPAIDGRGNDTDFRVEGDLSIGGSNSDATLVINHGSRFSVTGNLNRLGANSVADMVVVGSDFLLGGTASLLGRQSSSSTGTLNGIQSRFRMGGSLLILPGVNNPTPQIALLLLHRPHQLCLRSGQCGTHPHREHTGRSCC